MGFGVEDRKRYNVSKFLRENSSSDMDIEKLNTFIQTLDKHFNIDKNDPRYSHIYRGIDIIMKRVVSELAKADSYFSKAKLRPTGSIHSGVKVGLPHEADYLLDVPEDKTLDTGTVIKNNTLFKMVVAITGHERASLTEGLEHWVIHGVKHHTGIGGICLVMKCPSVEFDRDSKHVGVTVDLVPAYVLKSTSKSLNNKAVAFLPHSLPTYAAKGDLYRLATNDKCDTGLIENQIMKELSESKKQVFRVLKFLNQHLYSGRFINGKCDNIDLNETTRLNLYGQKPMIPSYFLRVYYLHMLLHVHGTPVEEKLSDGRFFMCLIDMLQGFGRFNVYHPLIQGQFFFGSYSRHPFREKIASDFAKMRYFNGELSLLNSEDQLLLESQMADAVSVESLNRVQTAMLNLCCCCKRR